MARNRRAEITEFENWVKGKGCTMKQLNELEVGFARPLARYDLLGDHRITENLPEKVFGRIMLDENGTVSMAVRYRSMEFGDCQEFYDVDPDTVQVFHGFDCNGNPLFGRMFMDSPEEFADPRRRRLPCRCPLQQLLLLVSPEVCITLLVISITLFMIHGMCMSGCVLMSVYAIFMAYSLATLSRARRISSQACNPYAQIEYLGHPQSALANMLRRKMDMLVLNLQIKGCRHEILALSSVELKEGQWVRWIPLSDRIWLVDAHGCDDVFERFMDAHEGGGGK